MTEVHQLLCEGSQKVFKTLNLVAPSPPPLKKKKERKNRSHYLVKNHVDPWICEKKLSMVAWLQILVWSTVPS